MAAVGGNGQQPKFKTSGSWFGKDVKYCGKCGRGSTKVGRETCKDCGASEWIPAQCAGAEGLKTSMMNEAKMMNAMDGQENIDDVVMACSLQEAVAALRSMMDTAATSAKQRGDRSFELRGVHLGKGAAEGKELDDLLAAFLYWAQKPECREAERFNISKAMRRLESFAQFQEKYFHQYFSDPVLPSEAGFASVADTFKLMVPKWTSKDGHVMWIMDTKAMQLSSEISHVATMRYFWWIMLQSVFDYPCAIEGAVIIETFDGVSFRDMIKLNSKFAKVEKELQDLFYGCAPFKMKTIVIVGSPWWINWIVAIMRMFISNKMSERIVNTDEAGMYARFGGPESFPRGFYHGSREYVDRYPGNITQAHRDTV